MIPAGTEREQEIISHLHAAQLILMLVSPSFFDNEFCYRQMQEAWRKHQVGEAIVIPILMRPVDWQSTILSSLQSLPRNGRPVSAWQEREEALYTIAQEIRRVVEILRQRVILISAPGDQSFMTRLRRDLTTSGIIEMEHPEQPVAQSEALSLAMRMAAAVVLIASPDTPYSQTISKALQQARIFKRQVIIVRASGDELSKVVPEGWHDSTVIDARGERYEQACQELVTLLRQSPPIPVPSSPSPDRPEQAFEPHNPYKGLQAFTRDDARYFFGREELKKKLVGAVQEALIEKPQEQQDSRLLAVIGPSGSGKSSVVMAGLLPLLQEGSNLPGSDCWLYLDRVLPGTHPLEALALALAKTGSLGIAPSLQRELESDSKRTLHVLASQVAPQPETKVVLLIDQFEEVFTQTASERERQQFIELLVTAVSEPRGPVFVILTLRADFSDRPLLYTALSNLVEAHRALVLPMELQDLRAAIEQPALLPEVALSFEENLVDDILFELQGQAGALPMLQFTLEQLFLQRKGRVLTRKAYQEMHGVKGALAKHAEDTYLSLFSDEQRSLARTMFLKLIEPGVTDQDITRRRVPRSEFEIKDPISGQLLEDAIEAFIKARLLTSNEAAGTTIIEISHEALIREWERLADWLQTSRSDLVLQKSIRQDVADWLNHGKSAYRLYRGDQLVEMQAWEKRNPDTLSRVEMSFLQASIEKREQEEAEKDAQRRRELALKEQVARRQRTVFGLMGVVAIILVAALIVTLLLQAQVLARFPPIVTNIHDSGEGSLREAIRTAHSGDAITFAKDLPDTLTLTSGELKITTNLVISGPDAPLLAISGGHTSRVFDISPGVVVTISKLKIKDGYAAGGKGVASDGGGIFNGLQSVLTFTDCIITGNTAVRDGGGIENHTGTLILINTTVSNNRALMGAGVNNSVASGTSMSRLTLNSSMISNNIAATKGGGVYNEGELTLINTTVSGNTATTGGGINNANELTLIRSTISVNTASGDGGGIANIFHITLTDSTLSGNTAGGKGGGIMDGSSEFKDIIGYTITSIIYCTIYGNMSKEGGGIDENTGSGPGSPIYITASIVGGNHADSGPDIVGTVSEDPFFNLYYPSLIQNVDRKFLSFRDPSGAVDNELIKHFIIGKSPNLAPLKNNGGLTPTQAVLQGSPAIDQIPINTAICRSSGINLDYSLDQRGRKRPQGSGCDLGAYEYP